VGRVVDSVENDKVASWYNDTRAIVLAIQRQPGTNTVEVVNSIRELLPVLRAQIPASVDLAILYDRSASIRDSVGDVKFTLLLAICLVVMVIFLFLRNLSATVIPSLALPISIVGTFAVMYLLGYSLDNLSLMALTLAVGFVVDDAIVMLENIVRHMEEGEGVLEAAVKGSREIGFTILSMTLSLAVVFLPVMFMGGVVGRLLHEFAVTICAAILVSGVVSLTLTPMLCSRFLRPPAAERHGRLYAASEKVFDAMLSAYDRTLTRVLQRRTATILFSFVLLGVTVYLFMAIPKGFLPNEDTGAIFGFTEAAQGISFDDMARHQQAVSSVVRSEKGIHSTMSSIGPSGPNIASNSGRVFLMLKPREERKSADAIIQDLRPKLAGIPGVRAFLQILPPIRIGGQLTKSQYQLTLQSPDTDELYRMAPVLESKMRDIPGLQDVTSDLQIANPHVHVAIDRDKERPDWARCW
jgi:HAE1 family hydrophobic/amphiphilic exporter-1